MEPSVINENATSSDTLVSYPHIYNVKHDDDKNYRGSVVETTDEQQLTIGGHHYLLVDNIRQAFDPERLGERFENILNKYDFIVGDWGFDQLRLRGFYDDNNQTANRDQTISTLEDYLLEFCNFGCAYFVIQKDYRVESRSHVEHTEKTTTKDNHLDKPKRSRRRNNHRRHKPETTGSSEKSNQEKNGNVNLPKQGQQKPKSRSTKMNQNSRDHTVHKQKNTVIKPKSLDQGHEKAVQKAQTAAKPHKFTIRKIEH